MANDEKKYNGKQVRKDEMMKKLYAALWVLLCFVVGTYGLSEGARVTGGDDLITTVETPVSEQAEDRPSSLPAPMKPSSPKSREPAVSPFSPPARIPAFEKDAPPRPAVPAREPALSAEPAGGGEMPELPRDGDQYITIDFDNVDIRVFIKFMSEVTGKNFIIDPNVKANVTVVSPRKISMDEAYRVFESVLEVYGFTTVPAGDIVKVVPAVAAREKSIETRLMEETTRPDDRVVTQIIPLQFANPAEIQKVLTPLVSRSSIVLSYQPTGTLIVTDVLSNIKRLMAIVEELDVAGIEERITVVPLAFARADDVAASLNQVFQGSRRTQSGVVEGPVRIVPDARTNAVIILAGDHETQRIKELVDLLDREVPRSVDRIRVYRLQHAEAETLAKVLMDIPRAEGKQREGAVASGGVLSKDVQIIADKATNALIITADTDDYLAVEEVLCELDIPRPMVYIEALIMEVNVDRGAGLGVEWTGGEYISDTDGRVKVYGGGFSGPGIMPGADKDTGLISLPEGFSLGVLGETIKIGDFYFPNLGAVFQAYQKEQGVHILSTPQILTLDNEEAEIYVGENVPYQTKAETTDTLRDYSSYEYRDVGVTLRITPQINYERFVRLNIFQEITKLSGQEQKDYLPSTLKRTAKTTVTIKDENTIVIGGLIGDDVSNTTWQVPCLGRIPLLGWLFRHESEKREKRNLYIFITPHIVENHAEARALYEEKRQRMDTLEGGEIRSKRLRKLMGDDE
ncbi:MAG: hypothetical protein AVO39_03655 [delta proteobacterium MLS_D]|jgi:general secretion pathway protein D|nr:MAG: hypothetical protein AVO39_03655 [delta proteobacterium MLS_D]